MNIRKKNPNKQFNLLKIYMYTPSSYGGHALYSYELLSALNKIGLKKNVQVSLVTSQDLKPEYRNGNYPVYDILPLLKPRNIFRNKIQWGFSRIVHYTHREAIFQRWLKQNKIDGCIHFQEYAPWLSPRYFKQLHVQGLKLFYTVHNIYPHTYPLGMPRWIYHFWRRRVLKIFDGLFVHTEGLKKELITFLGKTHPPIFVVPHGIWTITEDSLHTPCGEKRAKLKHLLFFGVIRPNKGLHILLEAMEQLPEFTLTVAGSPYEVSYQNHIRFLVKQLPHNQVKMIDRFITKQEMVNLFSKSSLLILPYTTFSSQSGVLYDALAYGLPIVVTDVGGVGETVKLWDIGEVVPPNNPMALSEGIHRLSKPNRYKEVLKSIKKAKQTLSWKRSAEITLDIYRSFKGIKND